MYIGFKDSHITLYKGTIIMIANCYKACIMLYELVPRLVDLCITKFTCSRLWSTPGFIVPHVLAAMRITLDLLLEMATHHCNSWPHVKG